MSEVKDYSLENLEAWGSESMESGASPTDIHDTIVNTIVKTIKYHRACYRDSVRLLSLLRGNKNQLEVHETFGGTVSVEYPEDSSSEYFNDYYTYSIDENITIESDK